MEFQNTNLKVFVANATTGADETTVDAFIATGAIGEVTAVAGTGAATAAGSEDVMIVSKKEDGTIDRTERIPVKGIRKITVKAYAAGKEKIDYVGFNGTSGTIEVLNDNLYQINLDLFNYGSNSPESRYLRQGHYKSKASGNLKVEVAEGLVKSLIRNQARESYMRFTAGIVSSAAKSASGSSTGLLTFVPKTNLVTPAVATDTSNFVAGDLVFAGTAATSVGYRVLARNAGTGVLTLADNFNGVTTVTASGNIRSTAANVEAGSIGVKIEGVPQPFVVGKVVYEKIDWRGSLVDFGSTELTHAQAAMVGIGEGKRVAELEWFATGNFGEHYRVGEPNLFEYRDNLQAKITGTYETLTIHYAWDQDAFVNTSSPRTVQVFAENATNLNALITRLNVVSSINIATL
jgi:hypothetical protein